MPYEPHHEEIELVRGCLQGNALYQKKLFEKFYVKMLGICLRYAKDADEGQDILQDGYIKVFQKLEGFDFNCPLEAWVRKIMINTAIDKYRSTARQPIANDIDLAYEIVDDSNVLNDINLNDLLVMIQKLPAGYRMIFNMHVIEGFNHREIADELQISEGTSKSQLAKAKTFLQKMIKREYTNNNE